MAELQDTKTVRKLTPSSFLAHGPTSPFCGYHTYLSPWHKGERSWGSNHVLSPWLRRCPSTGQQMGNPGQTLKAKYDNSALSTTSLPGVTKRATPALAHLIPQLGASPCQQRAAAFACQPCRKRSHATYSSRGQISYLCSSRKGSGLGLRRLKFICQDKYRLCVQPWARSLICLSVGILWKGAVILP